MSARKSISPKTRFEVFKRDSFTCQYCGAQAPDAILHVDHINPVAGGGENDILNLITACSVCNGGKGARSLDDNSVIAKQKAQLDELNKRREQLEMLLQWRESLASLDDQYIDAFNARFSELTGSSLNDFGRSKVKQWLKRIALSDLLEALDAAVETYFKAGDPDPEKANALAGKAFNMVPRIVNSRKLNVEKPWMKDLFYIRAIIRNRMYCNDRLAIDLLERGYHAGADVAEMQDWAKRARSWTKWRNEMEEWVNELESEQ